MENREEEVINKLAKIIELIKEINQLDESLGSVLLSNIKFSMDLYEALAKEKPYLIKDVVLFYATVQGLSVNSLLNKTYPKGEDESRPTADEDLTKFIMNAGAVYEPDIDSYEKSVKELVSDFKSTVNSIKQG